MKAIAVVVGVVALFAAVAWSIEVDTRDAYERAGAFQARCRESCAARCMPRTIHSQWGVCACDATARLAWCHP